MSRKGGLAIGSSSSSKKPGSSSADSDLPTHLISIKPAQTWTVSETAAWLESIELPELKRLFLDQEVAGAELLELTDHDLREMGVDKLGHRKKIVRKIGVLKGEVLDPTTSSAGTLDASSSMDLSHSEDHSSSSHSTLTQRLAFRIHHNKDVHLIKYDKNLTFKSLRRQIQDHFGGKFRIKFKDNDGELLSMKREADFAECVKGAQYRGSSRVKLYLSERDSSQVATEKETTAKARSEMFEFFDCILDPVIIISELGIIQYCNSKVKAMLGYTAQEMIGQNVKIICPADVKPFHDEYLKSYLKTGVSRIIGRGRNVVACDKDGALIPIHLELSERTMANGKVYWIGVLKPVQASAVEKKSLLQQEREVLDTLIVPSIIIDEKGSIHGFNKAASKFFGYELVEVLVRNVSMLMPPDQAAVHDQHIQRYITTGQAKIIGTGRRVVTQLKDGSLKPIFLTVTEKKDGDKRFFTGILQEVK